MVTVAQALNFGKIGPNQALLPGPFFLNRSLEHRFL
ncbi:MAG: hypothetical protein ACI815_002230, partial [Psychroserpens sp.]